MGWENGLGELTGFFFHLDVVFFGGEGGGGGWGGREREKERERGGRKTETGGGERRGEERGWEKIAWNFAVLYDEIC